MRGFAIAIRSPDQALAIGSEHWETVEIRVEGDALLAGPVFVDGVKIEIAAILGIRRVGSKDNSFTIGKPVGSEVCRAVMSDLMLIGTVRVHDPDFEIAGADEAGREEVLVALHFLGRFGMLSAIDNFLAVVGPERPAIIPEFVRELLHVRPVGIHGVDIEITVTRGSEDDALAIASDGSLGVVA